MNVFNEVGLWLDPVYGRADTLTVQPIFALVLLVLYKK